MCLVFIVIKLSFRQTVFPITIAFIFPPPYLVTQKPTYSIVTCFMQTCQAGSNVPGPYPD